MKNRTLGYSLIQSFFWMCYAAMMGFASMYLLQSGFDNSQVGALIAAAGLLSALLQPVIAAYADKPGSMSLGHLIRLIGTVTLACALGLLLTRNSMGLTGLLFGLCMVLLQLTTPLVNALGIATVNSGERMNFGIARGFGSIGYAAVAYLLGLMAKRFGAVTVPICMALGFGLLMLSVMGYGVVEKRSSGEKQTSGIGFLRKYPRYAAVLVGLMLIFVSHTILNSFTYQIVEAKGGSSEEMGIAMAFCALIELPVLFLSGWMLKKVKCHIWFRMAGVFFFLKCLGTLLCTSIPGFYAVQPFQMFGWALMSVSAVFYIDAIMSPADSVKGQAFFTTSNTLGNVVGAVVAGRILDALGVQAMLVFGTVSALVGAVMVLVFAQRTEV